MEHHISSQGVGNQPKSIQPTVIGSRLRLITEGLVGLIDRLGQKA